MLKRVAFLLSFFIAAAMAVFFVSERAETMAGRPEGESFAAEAIRFRGDKRATPGKVTPPGALWHAKLQRDAMTPRERRMSPGISWSWLGPGNIGGRIRSIVVDPTNEQRILIGAVSGGIWQTVDGGQNWAPVDDFMASLCVNTMAIHPAFPHIMFAGTGEGITDFDEFNTPQGGGVFKSTDGGRTWQALASTLHPDFSYVFRVQVSQNGTVFAATSTGLFQSDNGGTTWQSHLGGRTLQVATHPSDPQKLLVSAFLGFVYWSDDGGLTFNESVWPGGLGTPSDGRIELAYSVSNPEIVYASVADVQGIGGEALHGTKGLYRSQDGGKTFALVNDSVPFLGSQGWYANALWVDPTNPNLVIVGGLDLYRSSDSGQILSKISNWEVAPASAHADQHVIVNQHSYGGSNRTIYIGNDGGIYRADALTVQELSGWTALNNQLGITQFYGASAASDGAIYGGTQDNGTLRGGTGQENWTQIFGGDGGFTATDPSDPNIVYGEYVNGQVFRSRDGGLTEDYIVNGLTDAGDGSKFNFISPLILDPKERKRLYVGGTRLWRCDPTLDTPVWESVKKPTVDKAKISTINVHPDSSDIVIVGHNDGKLYRSLNATLAAGSITWKQVGVGVLPRRFCSSIVRIGQNDVYATFMGYEPDNVWKSADGGNSWINIGTGLPNISVSSIAIAWGGHLVVGTDIGTFDSFDGGNTWTAAKDGLANVPVDQLVWESPNSLLAVTYGRGIYRTNLPQSGQTINITSVEAGMPAEISETDTMYPSMSADGSRIAFVSSKYVGGIYTSHIYVYDLTSRETTLVSKSSTGDPANKGAAVFDIYRVIGRPIISSNGRFVVFSSFSTNLDPADTDNKNDIYIHDLSTGTTRVASHRRNGGPNTRQVFKPGGVTPDGKFVLFDGAYYDIPTDPEFGGEEGVYLKNMETGSVKWLTPASMPAVSHGRAADGVMSDNARFIAFAAYGGYVSGDYAGINQGFGVYLLDRSSNTISFLTNGIRYDCGHSDELDNGVDLSISSDGRFVSYTSIRGSADYPNPEFLRANIFIYDRVLNSTQLLPEIPKSSTDDMYRIGRLSPNGQHIIYSYNPSGNRNIAVAMVMDRKKGTAINVSGTAYAPGGLEAVGNALNHAVSNDGTTAVFDTYAKLVETDVDGKYDIYVRR